MECAEKGLGVKKDINKAVEWYKKATDGGGTKERIMAMNKLGKMYEYGQGVNKNDEVAVSYYQMAAAEGDSSAQARIGWLVLNNAHSEVDFVCAYAWFLLASKRGEADKFENVMDFVGRRITWTSEFDDKVSNWKYGDDTLIVNEKAASLACRQNEND